MLLVTRWIFMLNHRSFLATFLPKTLHFGAAFCPSPWTLQILDTHHLESSPGKMDHFCRCSFDAFVEK